MPENSRRSERSGDLRNGRTNNQGGTLKGCQRRTIPSHERLHGRDGRTTGGCADRPCLGAAIVLGPVAARASRRGWTVGADRPCPSPGDRRQDRGTLLPPLAGDDPALCENGKAEASFCTPRLRPLPRPSQKTPLPRYPVTPSAGSSSPLGYRPALSRRFSGSGKILRLFPSAPQGERHVGTFQMALDQT
jgi:hypothetical protein